MERKVDYKGCHDGQAAGFVDLQTGEFTEVMRIRDGRDMDEFLTRYDISIAEIE